MNISLQVALVAAACLCFSEATPDLRLVRTKAQRPTRGFKNLEMMTARGFGKRNSPSTVEHEEKRVKRSFSPDSKSSVLFARGYGKRISNEGLFKPTTTSDVLFARGYGKRNQAKDNDKGYGIENFWDMLESQEREGPEGDGKVPESIPVGWFVNEMLNNPDFARSVVRKFIDLNQDGMLTPDELLRNA